MNFRFFKLMIVKNIIFVKLESAESKNMFEFNSIRVVCSQDFSR